MGVGKAIEENEEAKQGAMNAQRACIAKTRTQKNRTQKLRDAKGGGGGGGGGLCQPSRIHLVFWLPLAFSYLSLYGKMGKGKATEAKVEAREGALNEQEAHIAKTGPKNIGPKTCAMPKGGFFVNQSSAPSRILFAF